MSCNNIVTEGKSNSDLKSGNVIISLKSEPARTITPVNGKSYLDVAEWTVTFKETSSKLLLQYNTLFILLLSKILSVSIVIISKLSIFVNDLTRLDVKLMSIFLEPIMVI